MWERVTESQKILDILGKNLEIFYKFSRFISEKKFFLPTYVSVKQNFLSFTLFKGEGSRPKV